MPGPDQPTPREQDTAQKSMEPLKPEELSKLRDLFTRATQNGQYFGPFLMHTKETDIDRGGTMEELIAQRTSALVAAHQEETTKNVPMETYIKHAEEEARISVEADSRMEDLSQTVDIVSWPYTKGLRSLMLELHHMKRKMSSPFRQSLETNTVHPSFHIESSYKVRGRNGEADMQLYTYKQNLHEGQEDFGNDPRLVISFKPDGSVATMTVIYREISAGGVDNMGNISRLENIPLVSKALDRLQWPFSSGYANCALTLDLNDASRPSIIYGYGESYEKVEPKGTYTYNPRTDKFELTKDQIDIERAKEKKEDDHWSIEQKRNRSSFAPNAEAFVQMTNEMLSLIPVT